MATNPITWWEIQVSDLERAKSFYGGVFGWTFKPWAEGYEAAYVADGSMVGGLKQGDGDPAGRGIHVCFTVDADEPTLEQVLAKVTKSGGQVAVERTQIAPEMGWYATVTDPSGLSFDLWTGRAQ